MNPLTALTLGEIMSRTVLFVAPHCTLEEAAGRMSTANTSSLLVVSDGKPCGILTERDLLRLLNQHQSKLTPVSEVMSEPVLSAPPELEFTSAYSLVLNHHVRHLAVVDQNGCVIGMVSETDFRNHLGADLLRRLDDLHAVMDNNLPQLSPDATLEAALSLMLRDKTSYALVVEDGCAVGILTERDMAKLLVDGVLPDRVALRDVMHAPVLTTPHRTPVYEMAGLMQAKKLRHLVVVNDEKRVLGMVTLHRLMERIAATVLNEQTLRHQEVLENSRQHTQSLLNNIMQNLPDLVWLKDVDGVYLSCNKMFGRYFGASESEIVGKTDHDFLDREIADAFRADDVKVMEQGRTSVREKWISFADDGHRAYVETTKSPMYDATGRLIGVLGLSHDITSRIASTEKIQRLTHLYAALSQCNQAIVRSGSEAELFPQICRAAVQFGGMKMAWIGMLDESTMKVVPVAADGSGVEYLDQIEVSADPASPLSRGATGTAIREKQPFWCQDFLNDPLMAPWRERGQHFGWGSSGSLPLYRNGAVVGAFTLYSGETNAFDEASRNLLLEMAVDIGYALDNFDREATRSRLETQSESERTVLELLARGQTLPVLLEHIARSYETMFPGMLCSVLLLSADKLHLEHGAAPSLPEDYCNAIDGAAIGSHAGSCGTAAYTRKNVIVSDIAQDPLWRDYKEFAGSYGLAACWSVPILSTQNQVLGTFALYYKSVRSPKPFELAALERGAHLASLAIERAQTEAWLNKLSQAVQQSPNTIVITDLAGNVEYVNEAFVAESGYSAEEVAGRNQRMLKSGKTPQSTYDEMWAQLTAGETWRGELVNRRRDGLEYTEYVLISPVRGEDGKISNYLSIKENITAKKQAEARISQLAHFDTLTGLPNQSLLKDRVAHAIRLAQRQNTQMAVLFLDIDHFKNINDTLGHRIGDELLIQLASRLGCLVREEDTLSRMGGDEFILVLPGTDADGAAHVASKVLETVSQSCHIEQYELVVTPSIGIAMYPSDGQDFDRLYQNADVAMYRAKQEGRNNFCFYTAEMQQRSARRLLLENALRHALERGQFELHYQPQLSLQDGRVVGAEALLRWHHPELGAVSPAEFIPIAEESGMILAIGEWVLKTAVAQAKRWMDGGATPFSIAVNLSAVQFRQARLPERVMQILDQAGLPPEFLELELTESVAMDAPLAAIEVMNELHARGIRMAIDDFGTGYSSLSYLRKFKVSKLKVDQSFVRDLSEDAESRAIVTAIITLAASMGFTTIAEGVETASQLAFLRLQGCDLVQGYYFSKPLPAGQFEAYMQAQP